MSNNNFWENRYNHNYDGNKIPIASSLKNFVSSYINSNDKILDYGCGTGRVSEYIRDIYPTVKIHMYDTSETAIKNHSPQISNRVNIKSHTKFEYLLPYTKIICHRVLHNIEDADINAFFSNLILNQKNPYMFYISVKSKNCIKYQNKLNNINFVHINDRFYNLETKRYLKFYSLLDLTLLLKQHNIDIIEHGSFTEKSFSNNSTNEYIYVYANKSNP